MTAQTRVVNAARYEDGDTPSGSNYADLIDSFVSIADTTAQTITSDLVAPKFIATTEVSAPLVVATEVSASIGNFSQITATHVSASSANFLSVEVSGDVNISGNLTVDGTINLAGAEYGELYVDATAAVSASAAYIEVTANTTALAAYLSDFTVSAGSLVYGGTDTKVFWAEADLVIAASANNTQTIVAIAVDGSAIAKTEIRQDVSTGDYSMTTHGFVTLATGERVSTLLKGTAAGASGWTIKKMHLSVRE